MKWCHYGERVQRQRSRQLGIVTLVLLVLGNVGLLAAMTLGSGGQESHVGVGRAAAATAVETPAAVPVPPPAPPVPPAPAEARVLAVYGDGYAAGNELGGLQDSGWPARVATQTGARLVLHAAARAGYSAVGITGQDFVGLIQANPVPDAAVTILFGSRNDGDADPAQVSTNAAAAISVARANAPGTALVVVGPAWSDGDVPGNVLRVRDAVRAAAEAAGATFVDPLADAWFAGGVGLIAADGISPTDDGHAHMAGRIAPVIETLLRTD